MQINPEVDAEAFRKKAEEDWESMELYRTNEYAPYGPMCFHSQQYVEKNIKAKLLDLGIVPPKIHSLLALSKLFPTSDVCESILRKVIMLEPYAVDVRYPDMLVNVTPTEEEAAEAYETAKEIIKLLTEI
jgi:HEPN domain-containing protein